MSEVEVLSGPPRFTLDAIRSVVTAACRREGADLALLFGSYARGEADAYSDVDVLIVWPTEHGIFARRQYFLDVLAALPGCDLLIYTPGELEELRERGVVRQALAEGIALYRREPG